MVRCVMLPRQELNGRPGRAGAPDRDWPLELELGERSADPAAVQSQLRDERSRRLKSGEDAIASGESRPSSREQAEATWTTASKTGLKMFRRKSTALTQNQQTSGRQTEIGDKKIAVTRMRKKSH